ncbi:hypothetical protein HER10_EVM0010836 [Colletotrichum scovillei]|uniref:uncharacterized protein n=1 Tax=Colletotrichum scovillei TaxID=1209932 RepID=UPI0015C31DBF|nr:uncharacterized protein HER10_EVM0010836 [Colletotrichum scovillei]KAF4781368.1 hypothetical protein HER10_EVM0010836 [Colletotrichum scovillei]
MSLIETYKTFNSQEKEVVEILAGMLKSAAPAQGASSLASTGSRAEAPSWTPINEPVKKASSSLSQLVREPSPERLVPEQLATASDREQNDGKVTAPAALVSTNEREPAQIGIGLAPKPRRPLPTSKPKQQRGQEANKDNQQPPSPPAVKPATGSKAAPVAGKKAQAKTAAAANNKTRTNAAKPADKKPQTQATSGEREICKCSKCLESNPEGIEQCAKTTKEHIRADRERNKGMRPPEPCKRCLDSKNEDECFYSGGKVCSRCMKLKESCTLNPSPGKGRKRDQDKVKREQKKKQTESPAGDENTDEAEEVLEVVEPPKKKTRTRASKKSPPAAQQPSVGSPAGDEAGEPPAAGDRERSSSDDGSRTIGGSPSSSGATVGESGESSSSEPCGSPPGKGRVEDSHDS